MSELRAGTISDAAGTGPIALTGQWTARANYNYNQSGTPSVTSSNNVSSITDEATGDYETNFTNSFSAATYSCGSSGGTSTVGLNRNVSHGALLTSSCDSETFGTDNVQVDIQVACGQMFGDLA